MKLPIALMLAVLLASPPRATALDANTAAYVGGTVVSFNAVHAPIEGRIDLESDQLVFVPFAGSHAATPLRIEYQSVRGLELGQVQDRRPALVAGATALLGPVGLLSLSARRRAHYLTVMYVDDSARYHVAVLELGKHVVRATLDTLEARSGVDIEYQDEAARKWRR